MKLSRNRFPHLAAGAAALPFASRVAGKLYAEVMETQLWRSNVGIAEFGQHNLHHLGSVCANNSDSDVYDFVRARGVRMRCAPWRWGDGPP
jgi:hypothetical protein